MLREGTLPEFELQRPSPIEVELEPFHGVEGWLDRSATADHNPGPSSDDGAKPLLCDLLGAEHFRDTECGSVEHPAGTVNYRDLRNHRQAIGGVTVVSKRPDKTRPLMWSTEQAQATDHFDTTLSLRLDSGSTADDSDGDTDDDTGRVERETVIPFSGPNARLLISCDKGPGVSTPATLDPFSGGRTGSAQG